MPDNSSSTNYKRNSENKYSAFISYSHRDKRWGTWLHHRLETFPVPKSLVGQPVAGDWKIPTTLHPVFRDMAELGTAPDLGAKLEEKLRQSRVLIVICSRAAAHSEWVNEEVRFFKSLGRGDRVLCLLVDGEPNVSPNEDASPEESLECLVPALRYALDEEGQLTQQTAADPLAADVRPGHSYRDALLKIVAGLLNVEFDTLKRRELQRRLRRQVVLTVTCLLILVVTGALGFWANAERKRAVENLATAQHHLNGERLGKAKVEWDKNLAPRALPWLAAVLAEPPALTSSRYDHTHLRYNLTRRMCASPQEMWFDVPPVSQTSLSPDGSACITTTNEGCFLRTIGQDDFQLSLNIKLCRLIQWTPDGQRVFIGDTFGPYEVWDVAQRKRLWSGDTQWRIVDSYPDSKFRCDRSGERLLSVLNGTIRVHNLKTNQSIELATTWKRPAQHDSKDKPAQADDLPDVVPGWEEPIWVNAMPDGVTFNPDGAQVVACDKNGFLTRWNTQTGQVEQRLQWDHVAGEFRPPKASTIGDVAFIQPPVLDPSVWWSHTAISRDAQRVAWADSVGHISMCDLMDDQVTRTLDLSDQNQRQLIQMVSLGFATENSQVLRIHVNAPFDHGGLNDAMEPLMYVWHISDTPSPASVEDVRRFLFHHDYELSANGNLFVHALQQSPSLQRVQGVAETTIHAWDTRTGLLAGTIHLPWDCRHFSASADGARVLSVANYTTGLAPAPIVPMAGSDELPEADENELYPLNGTRSITSIWQLHPSLWQTHSISGNQLDAALSHQGHHLATLSPEGKVQLWNADTGQALAAPALKSIKAQGISFGVGGRLFIYLEEGDLLIYPVADPSPLRIAAAKDTSIAFAELSSQESSLLTGQSDGVFQVYQLNTGEAQPLLKLQPAHAIGAEFADARGRELVVYFEDGSCRLWSVATGEPITEFIRHQTERSGQFAIQSAFRLGEAIATLPVAHESSSPVQDPRIRRWNAESQPAGPSLDHDWIIIGAALTDDEQKLATWTDDRIYLWDFPTGRSLTPPIPQPVSIMQATFNTTGTMLAVARTDGSVQLWDAVTGDAVTPSQYFAGDELLAISFNDRVLRLIIKKIGSASQIPADSSQPEMVQIWSLPLSIPPELSAQTVSRRQIEAKLLSGYEINDAGGFVRLGFDDIREGWQSYHPATISQE